MGIDIAQFQKAGVYQAQAPIGSILQDLQQIGTALAALSASRRKTMRFGAVGLIGGIAGIIGSAVASAPLGILLAVIVLLAGIGLMVRSSFVGRGLVEHVYRQDILQELLVSLQQDAETKAPFSVNLNVKGAPEKLREEPWPVRKKGKQQFLRDQFLKLEGELMDGTVIAEQVDELSRKRTYVNPRGKYKTKTRKRYLLTLRFGYPADLYTNVPAAQESLNEQFRMPSTALVKDLRVTEKAIIAKVSVNTVDDVQEASAMAWMGAYRILNFARRTSAGASGSAK